MKTKSLAVISALLLICVYAAVAFASNPVKLFVNGQEIVSDIPAQIIEGRTMVPVRWIAEALGAEVQWDEQNRIVRINKPYYVASLSEAEAKLYPFEETNGMYNGFILEVQENRQYFNWKNISNPTFAPRILLNDINQDGNKELIIILTTGTGTGVHTEDIHVLNPSTFAEIEAEDPVDIIKQNVNARIELNEDQAAIQIIIGDEEITVYKEKDYAVTWFDKVAFSNVYYYEVINNELKLSIPAQVSSAGFIGGIEVTYLFNNGRFEAGTINYTNQDDSVRSAVVSLIEGFGKKLQTVSLLAPEAILKENLQKNYGGFVSPNLLAEWERDLQKAPGRVSSSPWPDRIEILSTEKLSDSAYEVKGEIIEMTSVEMVQGGFAAKRPITLTVESIENHWLITAMSLGGYGDNDALVYKNLEYGFSFSLPGSWQGYSIITDQWEGFASGSSQYSAAAETGPLISIRHPLWTAQNQRQDIPIMIFTLTQWELLQQEEFHIGAAPIGPRELGRNTEYIFALPPRYNYSFPTGYEEVERILENNPLR